MTRFGFVALVTLVGFSSTATAQMYFHAPAYTVGYAPYTAGYAPYTTAYAPAVGAAPVRGGFGPLGIFNPLTWFGWRPYTSPWAASATPVVTAAYSPTYTAAYAPISTASAVTSYYAPSVATVAYYSTPITSTAVAAAPSACCPPCPTCVCPTCPGGVCAMYAPVDMTPRPDPVSGSGTRTFQGESNDGFRDPLEQERPIDGYESGGRGAGYRPESRIEQRAPTPMPEEAGRPEPAAGLESLPPLVDEPDAAAPLLNLDTKITSVPAIPRERTSLRARFGSPQLARAKVDPATLPGADELRLVRK